MEAGLLQEQEQPQRQHQGMHPPHAEPGRYLPLLQPGARHVEHIGVDDIYKDRQGELGILALARRGAAQRHGKHGEHQRQQHGRDPALQLRDVEGFRVVQQVPRTQGAAPVAHRPRFPLLDAHAVFLEFDDLEVRHARLPLVAVPVLQYHVAVAGPGIGKLVAVARGKDHLHGALLALAEDIAQFGAVLAEFFHVDGTDAGTDVLEAGIRYATNKKLVKRWERLTDKRAIGHNLGYQLLAWSREVHSVLEAAGRGQNYLTPAEIELEMQSRRL